MAVALANTTLSRPTRSRPGPTSRPRRRSPPACGSRTTAATCRSATTRPRCPRSPLPDLLKPAFKGKVALNGDPTKANAALNGVMMTSLANGGSADDISKGVDFFHQLKQAGNFVPVQATTGDGQERHDAGRPRLGLPVGGATAPTSRRGRSSSRRTRCWAATTPRRSARTAPHPAAARLWEEYLYSDDGQNLWLKGGARPVRSSGHDHGRDHRCSAGCQRCRRSPVRPSS